LFKTAGIALQPATWSPVTRALVSFTKLKRTLLEMFQEKERLRVFITSLLLFHKFAAWGQHRQPGLSLPDSTCTENDNLLTRGSRNKVIFLYLTGQRTE
jgi:hypothetical protein